MNWLKHKRLLIFPMVVMFFTNPASSQSAPSLDGNVPPAWIEFNKLPLGGSLAGKADASMPLYVTLRCLSATVAVMKEMVEVDNAEGKKAWKELFASSYVLGEHATKLGKAFPTLNVEIANKAMSSYWVIRYQYIFTKALDDETFKSSNLFYNDFANCLDLSRQTARDMSKK